MRREPDAGPIVVHVPRNLGGVRHVTDALSTALEERGRTVLRAANAWEVVKARRAGATGAILSLQTGFLSCLFPRSVYVLHGFPIVDSYSPVKRAIVRNVARAAKKGGARLVAVSHLTKAIHERLYGIGVDAVVFNGCSEYLVERAAAAPLRAARRKQIVYLGRLIDDKRVRTAVRGFLASSLPSRGYALKLAGGGPLEGWIRAEARGNPALEFLGEIHDEAVKADLLFESEALVSLNEMEPMGVVFVEAVLSGCKIVAPYCGGQREFIPADHPLSLCDSTDVRSVAAAFDRVPALPAARPSADVGRGFSYRDRIAPAYLAVLEGDAAAAAPASAADRDASSAAA